MRRLSLLFLLVSTAAFAQDTTQRGVRVGLVFGSGVPGVAVLPVAGANGDSVRAILQRDLMNGDRVNIVGQNMADLPPVSGTPDYTVFQQMNVQGVVQASVTASGELHVALYLVQRKELGTVKNFPLTAVALSPEWRMDVHRAADEVELWLTGVKGIAATRIAFVRNRQIWTVDSDGANAAPVEGAGGGSSPTWHPSGRYLAFSTVSDRDAGGVSIRDMVAGTTRRVTRTVMSGTFSSASFSPDGKMLAYSYGTEGTDIFLIDPFKQGDTPKNITVGRSSMNMSPTFSPDGRRIAFTTSRLNHPDVYIADVDGSNATLLNDGGFTDQTKRTDPAWSPDNRYIAYVADLDRRGFQIMLISPNGRNNQAITSEGENEDPHWAPDGRHIVFKSNRSGTEQLWVLDTESARARQLTRGARVSGASWSSRLEKP